MTLNESNAEKQLEWARNFLELSQNEGTCGDLRNSDCIQLLVQMMHANDSLEATRKCAGEALHNIVHSNEVEKEREREMKMLRLLDQILEYSNFLRTQLQSGGESIADDADRHPHAAIKMLMKASFSEENSQTMCELGALKAIPNLVHLDHAVHGPAATGREQCNSMRSHALMALTNLTFGDKNVHNKAYLCGQKHFMEVLIAQLDTAPDDLLQVIAGVLRNLSWRADKNMKALLNEMGAVTALALAAMKNKSENTLKAILSALWNLSAHCSTNKAEFCAVDGALAFLVRMLKYEGPSKTLKISENAGGILRNVSSHIAVCESYRQILREHNCLAILLQQLKSESLTVVSNSCGTLWNLSARCPEDQQFLFDHNAIPLLRALVTSKNQMIAEGSSSALKNLENFRASLDVTNETKPPGNSETLPRRYSSVRFSANPTGSLQKAHVLPKKCESRESLYSGQSSKSENSSTDQRKLSRPHAPAEEQPIDYSMKYSEDSVDLIDQPTDFSARYKEKKSNPTTASTTITTTTTTSSTTTNNDTEDGNEILLILDESSSTISTEVPMPLTKSASVSDLSNIDNRHRPQRPNTLSLRTNAIENLAEPKTPPPKSQQQQQQTNNNNTTPCQITTDSAMETPLMFSRRSSMDSLVDDDDTIGGCDDNASVISEYSRMQSGVISPSELPDSPTQSMPQTPPRAPLRPHQTQEPQQTHEPHHPLQPHQPQQPHKPHQPRQLHQPHEPHHLNLPQGPHQQQQPHEPHQPHQQQQPHQQLQLHQPKQAYQPLQPLQPHQTQQPHQQQKRHQLQAQHQSNQQYQPQQLYQQHLDSHPSNGLRDTNGNQQIPDEPRSYCTEDTPALLSKACSNSTLSQLSMDDDGDINENLSSVPVIDAPATQEEDAISKMRCGGNALPSYLPVNDEMSKYFVEDSPCNFSVISGLSNLTVGSAQVGPMRTLHKPIEMIASVGVAASEPAPKLPPRRSMLPEPIPPPKRNDSLSSLSIGSDDDCNLLSQAIAAGSGRCRNATTATTTTITSKTDYSSDDSSDSLDDGGQSKSLFEQCILSGMHKSNDALEMRKDERSPNGSAGGGGGGGGEQRFVSNQVRQIENMLANHRPTDVTSPVASNSNNNNNNSSSSNQGTKQSRHHHGCGSFISPKSLNRQLGRFD